MRLTTQKLHSIIRSGTGCLCSKYSPSQKIDRTTYSVYTGLKHVFGITSSSHITDICKAFDTHDIKYDSSEIDRGFIKVYKIQNQEAKQC